MEQIIGIDPDIEKNGVAIIHNGMVELFTFNFVTLTHTFFKNLQNTKVNNPGYQMKIFVEAGYLNRIFFQPVNATPLVIGKINRNIGENHATAKHIIECAKFFNLDPIPVLPVRSTNYKSRGKKITHPQFVTMLERNNIYCNQEITNQETRDAALIAVTYGINQEHTPVKEVATEKKVPQFMSVTN